MNKKWHICISMVILFGCSSVCGLNDNLQNKYDQAVDELGDFFRIDVVPCEGYYINVYLKQEQVDTMNVNRLHKILYDSSTRSGWQSLIIYSKQERFLFTHSYSGKISKKAPKW